MGETLFRIIITLILVIFCNDNAICHDGLSFDGFRESIVRERKSFKEFVRLKELLEERGVRGWIMGGSAFAYAHFIREFEELRDSGLKSFVFERDEEGFFSLRQMLRTTQDIDIVIDAGEEERQNIEAILNAEFPYFLPSFEGGKPSWEIRLLRSESQHKVALIDNPEFLNIHNDSGSIGLIELSDPPDGETVVRDIYEWDTKSDRGPFLTDVFNRELTYFYNPKHHLTKRAMSMKNPAIFSVIRYLTKAFQMGFVIPDSTLTKMKKIITRFNGLNSLHPSYGIDRIRRLAIKMLITGKSLEKAWEISKNLSLLDKLWDVDRNITSKESLKYFLSRKPLKSFPVGLGEGRTAKELEIEELTWLVKNPWEFECLLHAGNGEANLLSKKYKIHKKKPIFGVKLLKDDFEEGMLPIKMKLNPNSRQGSDFYLSEEGVIVVNKAALSVPQDSLLFGALKIRRLSNPETMPMSNSLVQNGFMGGDGYFSASATVFLSKLGGRRTTNDDILKFIEDIVNATRAGEISFRDFRRLLARAIGLSTPQKDFLNSFKKLYQGSRELQFAFSNHRGVFADSQQPDAQTVKNAFIKIEKYLGCVQVLLN